jgi:arylsulfatase B
VGRLREVLEAEGLEEDTIFVFTTDNGSSRGWRTFNAGMRDGKGSEYDGGHRVPFFVRWPAGRLTGGREVAPITAHVDVLPTLLDLCDIAVPEGLRLDGVSLAPLLDGSARDWPDRILVTDSQRVKDPIKWRKSAVMTSRWRLVNGEELYDITRDPGQRYDVAAAHPAVVERLVGFYERWWDEIEPTFAEGTAISLGHPAEIRTRLTSHDWITTRMTPWNQAQVRAAMTGEENTGFWNVNVVEAGDYEIRLRRWPEEAGAAIDAPLPPGDPVPGEIPFRATPGVPIRAVEATVRVGEVSASAKIEEGAEEVAFDLTLPAGKARMAARFVASDGTEYGAYYAYVRRR